MNTRFLVHVTVTEMGGCTRTFDYPVEHPDDVPYAVLSSAYPAVAQLSEITSSFGLEAAAERLHELLSDEHRRAFANGLNRELTAEVEQLIAELEDDQ